MHEVEDAWRKFAGKQHLGEQGRRPGRLLGWLYHDGVARDQGGSGHPERQREGKIEGCNDTEYAVGPEYLGAVLGRGETRERSYEAAVALHLLGVGLDQLDRLLDLSDRLGAALAGLETHYGGYLDVAFGDRQGTGSQPLQALAIGHPTPAGARRAGSFDCEGNGLRVGAVGTTGDSHHARGIQPLDDAPLVAGVRVDHVRPRTGLCLPGHGEAPLELRMCRGVDATARIGQPHGHLGPRGYASAPARAV